MVDIPKTRYARNGPVSIAYQTVGDGPLDVVLMAPAVSHLEIRWEYPPFAHVFQRLAGFSRLVMYDKRGCGLSDRTVETPTVDEDVADVLCVMDAVGVDRACLFGIGDGAAAALALAARHPDRVDRVAAYEGYARPLVADDIPFGDDPTAVDELADVIEETWGNESNLMVMAPSRADDRELARWWSRSNRAALSPAGAAAWVRRIATIDIRDLLANVRAPVLVTNRPQERTTDPRHSLYLADHLPDARHVEFPGEDYLMWVGDTDAILDEIEEFFTGTRPTHSPTRALATVMFTDIVDSTGRAAEIGDTAWRELLARHDDLTRRHVDDHGGRVIKSTGDGALATFDAPATAIAAAQALAADLREAGIELRVGIHMGEVEILGDDVAGLAVHLAARISALAQPDEIVVSRTVRDLMLGSTIGFEDRGTHQLKGVPGDWEILSVTNDPAT
jgi:class 3 adenylate cyclase